MRRIFALSLGAVLAATSLTGSAQQPAGPAAPVARTRPHVLPGTRVEAFSAIKGNALDAENTMLPNSLVRLRDARVGRIVDTQVSDKSGVFSFFQIDPGYYIVELFDSNQRTLAASPLISTNAGGTAMTSVRLPVSSSLLSSLLLLGGSGSGGAGIRGLAPAITDTLPQVVLQSIPAVVTAGSPASER